MNWLMLKRIFNVLPYIVLICLVLHYAYVLKQNDNLKQDAIRLTENIKQQQSVLDGITARTVEQERSISTLKGELEAKQYQDTTKVRKILSAPLTSGCSDSMLYLKQEASSIVFE